MFMELIPQRKSPGGGRMGGKSWEFVGYRREVFVVVVFWSLLDGKTSAEQLQCWETTTFPPLRESSLPVCAVWVVLRQPGVGRGRSQPMGHAMGSTWFLQR